MALTDVDITPENVSLDQGFNFRRSYNEVDLGESCVVSPRVEFFAIDLDGPLANAPDYAEHTAQIFLLRYDILATVAWLRERKNEGADLWKIAKDLASITSRGRYFDDREMSNQLMSIESIDLRESRDTAVVSKDAFNWFCRQRPAFVWTNRERNEAYDFLSKNSLDSSLLEVYGYEEGVKKKPHPDLLLRAKEELRLGDSGLMVGDSPTDLDVLAKHALPHRIELFTGGILPSPHGFNLVLERRLRECGAQFVHPSLNHTIKDVALHTHTDLYQLVKWEISGFDEFRFPKDPIESEPFAQRLQELGLEEISGGLLIL